MNKLEIGLSITGFVFVIFLIMNYSSFEMLQDADHTTPQRDEYSSSIEAVRTARRAALGNKRLIFYDVSTGVDPQIAGSPLGPAIDTIHTAVGAHARSHATIAANDIFNANAAAPRVVLNSYKNLIGPGMNTVLGIPKKASNGRGIGGNLDINDSQAPRGAASRPAYGSHGILGDMYRYRNPEGNSSSNDSWVTAGGWTGSSPSQYGSWQTNKGMSVGSHKQSNNSNDRPWERVKLLTDEMSYIGH